MGFMNIISFEQRCAVVRCLVDGVSIRATTRITGVAKNTIQKLTRELGEACLAFQRHALRNIASKRIQCDEIGSGSFTCRPRAIGVLCACGKPCSTSGPRAAVAEEEARRTSERTKAALATYKARGGFLGRPGRAVGT
jgi:hypothetical protein